MSRELDARVAEMMGWEWYTVEGVNVLFPPDYWMRSRTALATPGKHGTEDDLDSRRFSDSDYGHAMPIVPAYSTDIAAAWRIIDEMRKRDWRCYLRSWHISNDWMATFACGQVEHTITDSTAPLAICRAALAACAAPSAGEGG